MLTREMTVPLSLALHAREFGILPYFPVGIGAFRPAIACPVVNRGFAVPFWRDTGQHGLDLRQELLGPRERRAGAKARADRSAGVINEKARCPGLCAGNFPRVLIAGIGKRLTIGTKSKPVTTCELHM